MIAISKSGGTVALFQDLVCGEKRLIISTKVSEIITGSSKAGITYTIGG